MDNNIIETDYFEENEETTNNKKEDLGEKIDGVLQRLRAQAMLLGAQSVCKIILDKILVIDSPGKKSANDYKRVIKDIRNFCETGLKNTIDATHFSEQETVQN